MSVLNQAPFFDNNNTLQHNLLIKGNNLLALHALKSRLSGQVKLIYIDPPYNTGNDGFKYNDNFNHSSWLVFMKNRLEIAKELLANDGAIFVSIDDNEVHYLKVLMDEIFGRDNFTNTFIRKTKIGGGSDAIHGALEHEYILVFAKNKNNLSEFFVDFDEDYLKRYKEEDENGKYFWDTLARPGLRNPIKYDVELPDGTTTNQGWIWSKKRFDEELKNGNIRIQKGRNGEWQVHFKQYLNSKGKRPRTLLTHLGGTSVGNKEIIELFGERIFSYPKSEEVIQFIISLYTKPNDIVLDYHLGSGTTCAVAHKMGRRWIGIEQMDYIDDITKVRLQKVIEGEQGGISRAVNWTGGGSFVYFELKKYNQSFIEQILSASNMGELDAVYHDMAKNAFFKFWFDKDDFQKAYKKDKDDNQISLDERKAILINVLDENQLYLNHADMDDERYGVSDDEKTLTHAFYGE